MRIFAGVQDFLDAIGESLGEGDWLLVDQERVNTFAQATGDFQWIHVDPERAASSPFGGTIAHGYLTLSLCPYLVKSVYRIDGSKMGVNYGLNKVRFITPVKVGSRVRVKTVLKNAEQIGDGVQVTLENTIELEGSAKPACIAETMSRVYF